MSILITMYYHRHTIYHLLIYHIPSVSILFSQFKLKTDIDLEKSKPIIQLRHQISGDKSQYWCNDIKNIRSYSIEARNYAQIHGQDLLFASAVIVHSKITKLITLFHLSHQLNKCNCQDQKSCKILSV